MERAQETICIPKLTLVVYIGLLAFTATAPIVQAGLLPGDGCFDEEAYIQAMVERVIRQPHPPADDTPPAGIDPTNAPRRLSGGDFVLNASTAVARLVSGTPEPGATLRFVCAPPDAILTLTDPSGAATTAASTHGQEAYFYAQDLTRTGVWTLRDANGNLVTQFDTASLLEVEASAGTGSSAETGSGSKSSTGTKANAGCRQYWRSTRWVYENPAQTNYPADPGNYAPYVSRYWTLADTWNNGCGQSYTDARSLRHEFSIVGASKSTQGGTLYTAIVGSGAITKTSYGQDLNVYTTRNNGVYLDDAGTTYLKMVPHAPAAYQATSGGAVAGGSDSVMDLACAYVTQNLAWWASTMVCSGVNYITSTNGAGDVPYVATQAGWTDAWTGRPAGGISFTYDWKENTFETSAGLPMYKTSNTNQLVYVTTYFTTGGFRCAGSDCTARYPAPTEIWGAPTSFWNYKL